MKEPRFSLPWNFPEIRPQMAHFSGAKDSRGITLIEKSLCDTKDE